VSSLESAVIERRTRFPATALRSWPVGVDWAIVGALTVLAFALRLVFLGDSLLDDELYMYRIVHHQSLGTALSLIRHTEKTPPLFFLLSWVTIKLGDPTHWMRVPSLVCGTGLVPLGYALGTRTVGRKAGLVGATFLAITPFALYYGWNARAYAGLAFLSGASTLCLLMALKSNRKLWWLAYGAAVAGVLYTHYTGVFVLLVQAAWAFWTHRERIRELIVVHVLVAVAYAPWIPSFLLQQKHSQNEAERIALLAPPTWSRFVQFDGRVLFGHPGVALSDLPGTLAVALAVGVIVVAVAAALARGWQRGFREHRLRAPIALLGLAALAAPVGVGLYSLQPHKSFLLPRNLSSSFVAAELMLAWLLVSMRRELAVLAVGVMLVVMGIGTVRSSDHNNRNAQYRAAAMFIDAAAHPGDPVLEHFVVLPPGPLAAVLVLNFKHPHPVFPPGSNEAGAWARARLGAHVFLVDQLPGYFKKVRHLPRTTGPGKRFVLTAERRYVGVQDLLVGEYAFAGS